MLIRKYCPKSAYFHDVYFYIVVVLIIFESHCLSPIHTMEHLTYHLNTFAWGSACFLPCWLWFSCVPSHGETFVACCCCINCGHPLFQKRKSLICWYWKVDLSSLVFLAPL